ncbi:acetoacetyl-CoA synthetase [Geodermatophilus tzadiensis]|uniref:Acetoacetyl-CoA synthetase n=1 Tax=Geodermatophilus tzadiensis TaxID=1137988 RepID=A0A2T0TUI0_9ACTN|nr:acetoacetate--CoA ligase [Geodermatophilus tzadiensis]PRY49354.1 acetoacetyl-CoA synthetase [Geodermatophilus tzadiensis]
MTLAPAVPQLASFRARCEAAAGAALDAPGALHAFSVERPEEFWRTLLDWSGLPWSGSADVVLTGTDVETARFFPDLRLNYAEALLRPVDGAGDDAPALTAVHADRPADRWTRGELRDAVARTATALRGQGLAPGDRLVLVAANTGETAVVALAAAAVGAAVSTAAPDMGAASLLGRFAQVEPAVLVLDRRAVPDDVVAEVVAGLPALRRVLLLDDRPLPDLGLPAERLADAAAGAEPTLDWPRLAFDTPLFVMFSSGTTGPPKAMVHGAGGTLLEHVKEHRLHVDLGPGDTLYFHTTTAWMMWNWQLSALATGAHVVVYDGPVSGPGTLWELVAEHGVTVFGTSPAYLQLGQDAGHRPAEAADLSRLRAVLSTGAVLHDWQFDWVAEAVGPVPLQSVSGGTDVIGCFVLGAPDVPVRRGRCQTRSLGLDVTAVDEDGREVVGRVGELVCRRPFPSRPVGFLRDPDGSRFHDAYFADHPGVWTHGDLIEFDADGSSRLHGRSDGVLNVDGLRIGPSEIYTVLRQLPEIADAMAVEQRDDSRPGSSRMVLLVVLRPGARLDGGLERTIRRTLRRDASAAHVPSLVVAVDDLPLTHNGKRSERAARDAVNGDPVANAVALRDPGCPDRIRAAVAAASAAPPAPEDDGLLGRVSRIWCEVLGLRSADPDDDWSDLGGTSRQVLSLLRRVRLDLDADVPVQRFAEDATPAGLARAAEAALAAAPAAVTVLRAGAGRPVFLVPDAWGQLNLYAGLVERLATPRPVLGLRLPLRDGNGRHRTIEEVAADALVQVRGAQPAGPYTLLGYSFGGLVAHEVATRLRAAGEDVGCLGLLDVRPPLAALSRWEAARVRWAGRWATVRSGRVPAAVLRRVTGRGRPSAPAPGPVPATPDPELRFFLGSQEVSEAHRPARFDGPVAYFLAEGSRAAASRTLGAWRRVVRELRVVEVPGWHGDLDDERIGMLSDRHVATLAAEVSAALD